MGLANPMMDTDSLSLIYAQRECNTNCVTVVERINSFTFDKPIPNLTTKHITAAKGKALWLMVD